MIELLFYFCLPMASGEFDCDYTVYQATPDEINLRWAITGNKGSVAAMYESALKRILVPEDNQWSHIWHEFRHAACDNYYHNHNAQNHSYCLDPHFKVQ